VVICGNIRQIEDEMDTRVELQQPIALKDIFKRFIVSSDSRWNEYSNCHRCDFGEKFEYLEKLKFPEPYRNWANYRNGCLVQDGYRPKDDSPQCQLCFESWVSERKEDGKICVKCGKWIKGGRKSAAMVIEAQEEYEGGRIEKRYSSVCEDCLLQGKTVDEWATDIVKRAKKLKTERVKS